MEKTIQTFTRFDKNFILADTKRQQLLLLGTDFEKALFDGFKSASPNSKSLLCKIYDGQRQDKIK